MDLYALRGLPSLRLMAACVVFYQEAVLSDSTVEAFADEFERTQREAEASADIGRISLVALATPESIMQLDRRGINVEGALPVVDATSPDELYVTYTAWNKPDRRMSDTDVAKHNKTLKTASEIRDVIISRDVLHDEGLTPKLITGGTPDGLREQLLPRLAECYACFGYNTDEVEEILMNPANVLAYLQNESGDIASTALAERASIATDRPEPLSITEITDAFTAPDYRGRGLYRIVSRILVDHLLDEQGSTPTPKLIFGEVNLKAPGALLAAGQNGRVFSHDEGWRFGIRRPDFGILAQNFRIDEITTDKRYNDFALTYVKM